MSAGTDMTEYYARRAVEYEQIYAKPERQDDLRELKGFIEQAFAGRDVFEVACGTGYWTQYAARRARSFVATDFNEETLAIARAKQIANPELKFSRADAYDLQAFAGGFTGGLAAFWWSHVPKKRLRGFLEGFHSLLVPRARVVFVDNRFVEGSSTAVSRIDSEGNSYQTRRLVDGSIHEVLKNFPNEMELREAVNGLAVEIEAQWLPYYWILNYTTA